MTVREALVGKVVRAFGVAPDRESIVFQCTDGATVVLQTTAGCCSHTWIEGIEGVEAFDDAMVTEIESIELPEQLYIAVAKKLGVEQDAELFYGLRITTTKGRVVIDYRNDNAYYGGSLEVEGE